MQISVYADSDNRILSVCSNDMTGNANWFLTDTKTLALTMNNVLWDDHGACLYKVENGVAVPRSEEERRADWLKEQEPENEQTMKEMEQRVESIEADNLTALEGIAELYEMLIS